MSAGKHTPGPITALLGDLDSALKHREYLVRDRSRRSAEAISALLDTQADLIGALQLCREELQRLDFTSDGIERALNGSRAAIAKATGSAA